MTPLAKRGSSRECWSSRGQPDLDRLGSPADPTVYNLEAPQETLAPEATLWDSGQIHSLQFPGWQPLSCASPALLAPGSTSGGTGAAPQVHKAAQDSPRQPVSAFARAANRTWTPGTPQIHCWTCRVPCNWVSSGFQERPDRVKLSAVQI